MEITRIQSLGTAGQTEHQACMWGAGPGEPLPGHWQGVRVPRGMRSFHLDHVCTYAPAVSPHNLENEGPLVAGKEKGDVHSPRLGRAGTQRDKRGQPHTQQGCSVTMAGAPASKTGPVFYRSESYCKSLLNFCK